MNEQQYERVSLWFRESEKRYKAFVCIYRLLPCIMVGCYMFCVAYVVILRDVEKTARVILVPTVTFGACTVFRKLVDARRPYENMNIAPLIKKDKKGQSFPSRHTVSAVIIAMTALYINKPFGIVMLVIAGVVGGIRPIAGVHYVRDVVAGTAMGVLFGVIGFFVL